MAIISNKFKKDKKSILFLGYDKKQSSIISFLEKKGCFVENKKTKLSEITNHDFIISFGYKHIIEKEILEKLKVPVINLHISYLPWNRGSHPNFWSFYESTPSGVTIHEIDNGVDTGSIIFQKLLKFNTKKLTFEESYKKLIFEIEELFKSNIDLILNKNYKTKAQIGKGSHHKTKDLPKEFSGWDSNIYNEINRLWNIKLTKSF